MTTEKTNTTETSASESMDVVMCLPAELTPINLYAYFANCFESCGCSETGEMVDTVRRLMEWHDSGGDRPAYDTLYAETGVFYILAGLLDKLDLAEHGTSIRHPWLTSDGKRLLEALQKYTSEEIEEASGEAYDGLHYNIM
jgi:hypothetical protein